MNDREENYSRSGGENQRIGMKLYNKDKDHNQQRYGYRGRHQQDWDEGNNFHTGPNKRGAQDKDHYDRGYNKGGASNSSYNQGQNAHLNDHYGSRSNSSYRNERNYINHGDSNRGGDYKPQGNAGASTPGNYNEFDKYGDERWREHPGGGSRYKEDDYRYGSGSHNWYREGRYTPDEDRSERDDRGFFERVGSGIKDTWNDIMHSDDPGYQRDHTDSQRQSERISSRQRYGSEPYRERPTDNGYDRTRDRGYEGGPRWADETDSGDDDYYNDVNRNQRYRR